MLVAPPPTFAGEKDIPFGKRPQGLPLDMKSMENKDRDRHDRKKQTQRTRPLGLTEAPTFYPSQDEFEDPLEYVASIAETGRKYGIVKIVPPDSWRPEFAIDVEKFWFRTRKQELNTMEGGSRTCINYVDQLYKFHKQRGQPMIKIPEITRRPVDLYKLSKYVKSNGGFHKVSEKKLWANIGRELGYPVKLSSVSSAMKSVYQKYVLPYDEYVASAKPHVLQQKEAEAGGPYTPSPFASPQSAKYTPTGQGRISEASPLVFESPKEKKDQETSPLLASPFSKERSPSPRPFKKRIKTEGEASPTVDIHPRDKDGKLLPAGEYCETCMKDNNPEMLMLCDGCDCGYHATCLNPPIYDIPEGDWYCSKCLVGTGEFGFEEGSIYSLREFQDKANRFKREYFHNRYGLDIDQLDEARVEREFWRLVEDVNDSVEVEYGADIHSQTHGSGFATREKLPTSKYSNNPWNLNNLALLPNSLLKFVGTNLSGITSPWLYVGMLFATFCWHSEDHLTYSANYQHLGATKTWYGIPGEDTLKFEEAVKTIVPELLEQQPDLLFQLVTMISPRKLTKKGVHVYAVDQRPGDIIITFPSAYHSGFSHGFNFNEAVNFAPHDWEPIGRAAIERYRFYRKPPVFCHEELLFKIYRYGKASVSVAKWLAPALKDVIVRELATRSAARDIGMIKQVEFSNNDDEERIMKLKDDEELDNDQCSYCKAFCYLSYVERVTGRKREIMCTEHFARLGPNFSNVVLFISLSDEKLTSIEQEIQHKAKLPNEWINRLEKVTRQNERPGIKILKSLVSEGDKINCSMEQLDRLREFVDEANEWIEHAQGFLVRRMQSRKKNERVWRKNKDTSPTPPPRIGKISEIDELLNKVKKMTFSAPEIEQLGELRNKIRIFQEKADEILNRPEEADIPLDQLAEMVLSAKSMSVYIPEAIKLQVFLTQLQWLESLSKQQQQESNDDGRKSSIKQVEELIDSGIKVGLSKDHPIMIALGSKRDGAIRWQEMFDMIMKGDIIIKSEVLEDMLEQAQTIPVDEEKISEIEDILIKYEEYEEEVENIIIQCEGGKESSIEDCVEYGKVKKLIQDINAIPIKPRNYQVVEKYLEMVEDWMRQGKRILGKTKGPIDILRQELIEIDERNSACFSILDNLTSKGIGGEEKFCLCRQSESGVMIECEICHEWYHIKCLKGIDIETGDNTFICSICDYRVSNSNNSNKPTLEELQGWQQSAMTLPIKLQEFDILKHINWIGQRFREYLNPFIESLLLSSSSSSTSGQGRIINYNNQDVEKLRFYLRKLEGADILLLPEINVLRQQGYTWAPIGPLPPPMLSVLSVVTCRPQSGSGGDNDNYY